MILVLSVAAFVNENVNTNAFQFCDISRIIRCSVNEV